MDDWILRLREREAWIVHRAWIMSWMMEVFTELGDMAEKQVWSIWEDVGLTWLRDWTSGLPLESNL